MSRFEDVITDFNCLVLHIKLVEKLINVLGIGEQFK